MNLRPAALTRDPAFDPCPRRSRCPPCPRPWRKAHSPNGWSSRATRCPPGDIMAEIETDKATMEFEAVDEGVIASIAVEEGTEGVKVGTVIAMLAEEGEDLEEAAEAAPAGGMRTTAREPAEEKDVDPAKAETAPEPTQTQPKATPASAGETEGDRIKASPLARRIAEQKGLDLSTITGSGPNGRIVKADVEDAKPGAAPTKQEAAPAPAKGSVTRQRSRRALRGRKAQQCPQGHRTPPDRGEADHPAYLPHRGRPARRAAQASQRTQRQPRGGRH